MPRASLTRRTRSDDRLPVVEVEGRAELAGYLGDGHASGGELAVALPAEAPGQFDGLICLSKHC